MEYIVTDQKTKKSGTARAFKLLGGFLAVVGTVCIVLPPAGTYLSQYGYDNYFPIQLMIYGIGALLIGMSYVAIGEIIDLLTKIANKDYTVYHDNVQKQSEKEERENL